MLEKLIIEMLKNLFYSLGFWDLSHVVKTQKLCGLLSLWWSIWKGHPGNLDPRNLDSLVACRQEAKQFPVATFSSRALSKFTYF